MSLQAHLTSEPPHDIIAIGIFLFITEWICKLLKVDDRQVGAWHRFRADIDAATEDRKVELLEDRARAKRRQVVTMIANAGLGHIGGDLSVTDILTALYDAVAESTRPSPTDRPATALYCPRVIALRPCTRRWRCVATSRSTS